MSAASPAPAKETPTPLPQPPALFSNYEVRRRGDLRSYLGGYAVETAMIALLLMTGTCATSTPIIEHKKLDLSSSIQLVTPDEPRQAAPRPEQHIIAPPRLVADASLTTPPSLIPPRASEPKDALQNTLKTIPTNVPPVSAQQQAPPTRTVTTDVFKTPEASASKRIPDTVHTGSFGSSAAATLSRRDPGKVQTGGFGDPNGMNVARVAGARGNGATMNPSGSSFDLPSGPGFGNGTGGAKGARGTIASAGFGNGVAVTPASRRENGRVEMAQQFAAPQVVSRRRPDEAATPAVARSAVTPVAILTKPTPVYSIEGKDRRIEGEVLVDVVFQASGQIRILGVSRGLGYGLDEAALAAVRRIKFTPAKRDGVPIDAEATLHIVFSLS